MTKVCSKCKLEKELDEFYENKNANGKKYRKGMCKKCFLTHSKKYQKSYQSKPESRERCSLWKKNALANKSGHKEKLAIQSRAALLRNTAGIMLSRAKRRAQLNGMDFNLVKEDIVIPEICPILEIPIFVGTKGNYANSPSIDRVNSDRGYTKNNIRVISMLANTMKSNASPELLRKFSSNILTYIDGYDIVQTIGNSEPIELQDKELVG